MYSICLVRFFLLSCELFCLGSGFGFGGNWLNRFNLSCKLFPFFSCAWLCLGFELGFWRKLAECIIGDYNWSRVSTLITSLTCLVRSSFSRVQPTSLCLCVLTCNLSTLHTYIYHASLRPLNRFLLLKSPSYTHPQYHPLIFREGDNGKRPSLR